MEINQNIIHELILKQRQFFLSNVTLNIKYRIDSLKKLKNAIKKYEKKLIDALTIDLGRHPLEGFLSDVGPVYGEIDEAIKNLKKWQKPTKLYSGLCNFPSTRSYIYKMPYGVVLIISPFNFPVYLTFAPVVAAIAGGNTCVVKTSSKSSMATIVMKELIESTFDDNYIALFDGGHDVSDMLLDERFDKIFYTGSPEVGKHVLAKAAPNLTPCALELGGENGNWAIVTKNADIHDAARKIAFFKILNSGQICINVNQVAVSKTIASKFIDALKEEFTKQIGDAVNNAEYPKLINLAAFNKCLDKINEYKDKIIYGGSSNSDTLKISPTILCPIDINDKIVQKELFNPILPIVIFDDDHIEELFRIIQDREHGLALYLFTKDLKWGKDVMQKMQYGGGCINEVCVHLMVKGAPFNGVGHSGMGRYHGKWGFDEFTHPQTVLIGKTKLNLSLREHPYTDKKEKLIKKILK